MSFPFQRIFRLLLSQQPRADAVSFAEMPDETGENTSSAELSSTDDTVQQKGETPFHIFDAPVSGEGFLIFLLPQNRAEEDEEKRSRRYMRRQRSKARDMSRKAARQLKQLPFANAQH